MNFPPFDTPVAPGGYIWWYLDALSDDGLHGITLIALLGSVFSPYYALARRRGNADPLNHCALNVALYGKGGKHWAMTERGRRQVRTSPDTLRIGPSALHWDDDDLSLTIDEVTAPWPSRIRGRISLRPAGLNPRQFTLDAHGRHRWWPIAPRARIEIDLERPARRWSGTAYLDSNTGDEPLEQGFRRWDWSRAALRDATAILYDATRRDGTRHSLALRFDADARVEPFEPPPAVRLPKTTIWRIARGTQSEDSARIVKTLEDTPFYARSLVASRLLGEPITAMHESLSLGRFDTTWAKLLLPFRMPRRG
jgi:carotenoid 1,2-hydratase